MRSTVLLASAEKSEIVLNFGKMLGEEYDVIHTGFESESFLRVLKEKEVRFVLFYLNDDITPAQLLCVEWLCEDAKKRKIEIVVISSEEISSRISARSIASYVVQLERPISVGRVLDELYHMEGITTESNMKHILIVDDDEDMLCMLNRLLRDMYRLQLVDSGMRALEVVQKKIPDLVLLDYDMPFLDGKETLKALRNNDRTRDVPVIMLTGIADAEKIRDILLLKPQGYLLKASGRKSLIEALENFFNQS